jgi:hypothetical protein
MTEVSVASGALERSTLKFIILTAAPDHDATYGKK